MIVWLDHLIFGNGFGLKSPSCDAKFYWLDGELYTWNGWFGAQLQSFQWRHPNAGERRKLIFREFKPVHSERMYRWLWGIVPIPIGRVRIAWACALPKGIDEANASLREMQKELEGL